MTERQFIIEFQDHLAPKLDTYEQAIYLYLYRHTRLEGMNENVIPFKSARTRMACGIGERGKPMSESTASEKLRSLSEKGAIEIRRTEHSGRLIRVFLPAEIPGVIPSGDTEIPVDIEDMDFFDVKQNRKLILERENHRCFYTLEQPDESIFVLDHVISRQEGGNSYRNVVACSRESNNRKGNKKADDFIWQLFRKGRLNLDQFQDRLKALEDLQSGRLKPRIEPGRTRG